MCTVVRGELGSNECPPGYSRITDSDTCSQASQSEDLDPHPHENIVYIGQREWSNSSYPYGCVYFNTYTGARLNNAKNGVGNAIARLICHSECYKRVDAVVNCLRGLLVVCGFGYGCLT